ncbi:MAG: glucosaminidase domain-containing protein [Rhodospirillales bacterium]
MKFEYGAISVLGCVVATLVGLNIMMPPDNRTALPDAPFDMVTAAGPHAPSFDASGKQTVRHHASADSLWNAYRRMNYDFKEVLEKGAPVPRISLPKLPADLDSIAEIDKRKAIFFKTVLPLVLKVNEQIRADRRRLWQIRYRQKTGMSLSPVDRLWLSVASERYKVKSADLKTLFTRIDIIPPSLALAQAAEESGWGTSRFVREGNAIFGQWTFSAERGLEPREREDGKTHGVKAFDSLIESVRAYMHNLNTHRAYRDFRKTRAALRRVGAPLDGLVLATKLERYSERGWEYVLNLRSIILGNNLRELDDARLHGQAAPEEEPSV